MLLCFIVNIKNNLIRPVQNLIASPMLPLIFASNLEVLPVSHQTVRISDWWWLGWRLGPWGGQTREVAIPGWPLNRLFLLVLPNWRCRGSPQGLSRLRTVSRLWPKCQAVRRKNYIIQHSLYPTANKIIQIFPTKDYTGLNKYLDLRNNKISHTVKHT